MGIDDIILWPFTAITKGIVGIVGILLVIFWIWMIVDASKRHFRNDIEKIVWIVVVVLANWIGALVYLLVIRLNNPKGLMKR